MKLASHLDHIRHCKAASGANRSTRSASQVFITHTRRDWISTWIDSMDRFSKAPVASRVVSSVRSSHKCAVFLYYSQMCSAIRLGLAKPCTEQRINTNLLRRTERCSGSEAGSISGAQTCVSLNSRLESNKEKESVTFGTRSSSSPEINLSHRIHLLIGFGKSTPQQDRQLILYYY